MKYFIFAFCLLLSTLYMFPQIWLTEPNLLDIGETWLIGKDITQQIAFSFVTDERFRPVYYVTRTLSNILFDYHSRYYFLLYTAILAITVYLSFLLVNKKGDNYKIFSLLAVLFFISPVTVDTFYRVGAAENIFTILLVTGLYFLLRRRYNSAVAVFLLLMCAKETAVFYIPVVVVYLILKKKFYHVSVLGIAEFALIIKIIGLVYTASIHPDHYVGLFSSSLQSVLEMFIYYITFHLFYFLLFGVSLALVGMRIRYSDVAWHVKFWQEESLWVGLIVASVIALLFFHNKYQPYYFFPSQVLIIVFFVKELIRIPGKFKAGVLFYMLLVGIITQMPTQTIKRVQWWHENYVGDGALITRVRKDIGSVQYEFAQMYHPEYDRALGFYYAKQPFISKNTKILQMIDPPYSPVDGEKLCGFTVFRAQVCLWAIRGY